MMLDLDRFKEINDTLGHHVGDQALMEIAARLSALLRETDTVGRLGGDEFAIILPGADIRSAEKLAAKINAALESPVELAGCNLSLSGSLGIATYPDHAADEAELLKFADVAMYTAKRTSCGYFVYDARSDSRNHERLAFVSEIREGIKNNQFELFYQPQMELISGKIARVEVLARWPHPVKGMIAPDVFIPVMEQTGLIRTFTHWVLDAALGQWAAWRSAGTHVGATLGVNLSMHNLIDPSLPDQLMGLLKKWDVEGDCLMLEITESSIMHDPGQVIRTLSRLKETGVKFSVDDFGTGYSSLTYLKRLPVSEIKIDRSFVMEMSANADDAMIVLSTIQLAHNLGLDVVAEGVETREALDTLIRLECDIAQGYHISRPLPADKLVEFIKTWATPLSMGNGSG